MKVHKDLMEAMKIASKEPLTEGMGMPKVGMAGTDPKGTAMKGVKKPHKLHYGEGLKLETVIDKFNFYQLFFQLVGLLGKATGKSMLPAEKSPAPAKEPEAGAEEETPEEPEAGGGEEEGGLSDILGGEEGGEEAGGEEPAPESGGEEASGEEPEEAPEPEPAPEPEAEGGEEKTDSVARPVAEYRYATVEDLKRMAEQDDEEEDTAPMKDVKKKGLEHRVAQRLYKISERILTIFHEHVYGPFIFDTLKDEMPREAVNRVIEGDSRFRRFRFPFSGTSNARIEFDDPIHDIYVDVTKFLEDAMAEVNKNYGTSLPELPPESCQVAQGLLTDAGRQKLRDEFKIKDVSGANMNAIAHLLYSTVLKKYFNETDGWLDIEAARWFQRNADEGRRFPEAVFDAFDGSGDVPRKLGDRVKAVLKCFQAAKDEKELLDKIRFKLALGDREIEDLLDTKAPEGEDNDLEGIFKGIESDLAQMM